MLKKTMPILCLLLLASCAGTDELRDGLTPPGGMRQSELTHLYDNLGSEDAAVGESAAAEAARGDERDLRFLVSLWGTRDKSAVGARRLGAALSGLGRHQYAFEWYERAYMELSSGDKLLPYLRYDMAYEYVQLGRNEEAVNLLANRMSTLPLPEDLAPKYEALIKQASG